MYVYVNWSELHVRTGAKYKLVDAIEARGSTHEVRVKQGTRHHSETKVSLPYQECGCHLLIVTIVNISQ